MMKLHFKPHGDGEPIEVAIQKTDTKDHDCYQITLADRQAHAEIESTGPGAGWLRVQGRVLPFRILKKDGMLSVWLAGKTHKLELIDRTARRSTGSTAAAKQSHLQAPMPGTVLKINATPGAAFEAHAPLVVMESMKMEMTLSAPHNGRVKDVRCKPGQLVEMGAVLVTFAEDGHGGAA
ncbi:MAG: acetyl-CoA carboxylase biotin carboxyl carrier protein subunit [Planctomycetes bacterium]|nr:acetyl-CoA carboxylase biotin carboxyl carrier protein subunit [Planctomycetota bacterium]